MTDTTPDKLDPTTVEGYEPPVDGEDTKARRARKMRNRRRAEKAQRDANPDPAPSTPARGRPSAASKRAQSVSGVLTGVGLAVMVWDERDGHAIIEGAPALADSLAKVAEKNGRVAKALDALTETSAWAEVALAVGAIAIPIAKNHGLGLDTIAKPKEAPTPDPVPQPAPAPDPVPPSQVAPDAPVFTVQHGTAPAPVPTFTAQHD